MMTKIHATVLGALVLAVATPSVAAAQAVDNGTTTYTTTTQQDDDDGFPWGLLGLLGLAGLIPRKRHVHVDVDNRTHR